MRYFKSPWLGREALIWYAGLLGFVLAAVVLYTPYAH